MTRARTRRTSWSGLDWPALIHQRLLPPELPAAQWSIPFPLAGLAGPHFRCRRRSRWLASKSESSSVPFTIGTHYHLSFVILPLTGPTKPELRESSPKANGAARLSDFCPPKFNRQLRSAAQRLVAEKRAASWPRQQLVSAV